MVNLSSIHQIRSKLARNRQPEHNQDLELLDAEIPSDGSPYDPGDPDLYDRLMAHRQFAQGARGIVARPDAETYLYRYSSIAKALKNSNWKDDQVKSYRVILGDLLVDSSNGEDWLCLSDYADGTLSSPRGFTWWTSHEIRSGSILRDLRAVGLPEDWISPLSLIMRCRATSLQAAEKLFVPTVLDAYDSPIFHPTVTTELPMAGVTIDLNRNTSPTLGHDEYAIEPIPTSLIEFRPLLVRPRRGNSIVRLLPGLERYYSKLVQT